jgi:hypothetical protein
MFADRRRLRAPNVIRNGSVPSNIGICEVNERSCSRDRCTTLDPSLGAQIARPQIPLLKSVLFNSLHTRTAAHAI